MRRCSTIASSAGSSPRATPRSARSPVWCVSRRFGKVDFVWRVPKTRTHAAMSRWNLALKKLGQKKRDCPPRSDFYIQIRRRIGESRSAPSSYDCAAGAGTAPPRQAGALSLSGACLAWRQIMTDQRTGANKGFGFIRCVCAPLPPPDCPIPPSSPGLHRATLLAHYLGRRAVGPAVGSRQSDCVQRRPEEAREGHWALK